MKKIVIIGAGGHAREVLDILLTCQTGDKRAEVLGFIDEDPDRHGQILAGLPILGDFRWFEKVNRKEIAVICAVGTPHICRKLVNQAKSIGLQFANVISPQAWISPQARLGQGVIVFPGVIINTGAVIGNCVTLNVAVTVSHDTIIDDFCNINPGVHIAGNVHISEGCYIGMGANIIQGITIGPWSIIGAGAVVVRDIPANVTAVGVPAKVIKTREEGWYER